MYINVYQCISMYKCKYIYISIYIYILYSTRGSKPADFKAGARHALRRPRQPSKLLMLDEPSVKKRTQKVVL